MKNTPTTVSTPIGVMLPYIDKPCPSCKMMKRFAFFEEKGDGREEDLEKM
jgi:hypothetical protein